MTVTTERAALVAAAKGRPLTGGVRVLAPAAVSAPRPAPSQPEKVTQPENGPAAGQPESTSIEAVLAAAEASLQQKLRTKAARVREQIIELDGLVKAEAEARQVEARVLKLRDELSAAEAQLKTLRHSTPRGTAGSSTASSTTSRDVARAVRAWAKTNNIEVSAYGRVPNDLVQQWQDATGGIL
ncbi:Lsr2 family DNA-binding protein [Paractinoplanes atraurantiacus]|uniref:Lsr2 protein n=1 Tax=Paractinoplanes atraurantiacus TaxID=1036182 RepID=A0A285KKN6_9ACTN|nr:histone-like nucleoid-structuring protein Lsr2 [Actinoplanes atraurantiacus]SNY72773.1 Lsr2 protein [Actinoplanes atraurantiacus]